uniref:RPA-interacting protein C-terminal domain-containing protein n=1 Tax=Clastoptera arizonana TaxID=38151 RepID=A0A1B6DUL9_9HEMI
MAGIIKSPKISSIIKNKCAIERKKHGSPNFKEVLRQRCKERVKSQRCSLINQLRALSTEEDIRSVLTDILVNDLSELNHKSGAADRSYHLEGHCDSAMDTSTIDVVYSDLSWEEQWILDEYDRLLESNEALQNLLNQVVCPFCEKNCLNNSNPQVITCNGCNVCIHHPGLTLEQFENCLISAVDSHSDFCSAKGQFTTIPDGNISNVILICTFCSYIHNVI